MVFWPWVLLLPLASWALGHLLGSAARSSPTTRAKTGRTAHVFTAQGGDTPSFLSLNINAITDLRMSVALARKDSTFHRRRHATALLLLGY